METENEDFSPCSEVLNSMIHKMNLNGLWRLSQLHSVEPEILAQNTTGVDDIPFGNIGSEKGEDDESGEEWEEEIDDRGCCESTKRQKLTGAVPELDGNLDDRMEVDEVATVLLPRDSPSRSASPITAQESSYKKPTRAAKNVAKDIAFREMEEWMVAEGRMQDVTDSRRHVDQKWPDERRREAYEMLMELRGKLLSHKWTCSENGSLPLNYIESYLGKSQKSFTRIRKDLKDHQQRKTAQNEVLNGQLAHDAEDNLNLGLGARTEMDQVPPEDNSGNSTPSKSAPKPSSKRTKYKGIEGPENTQKDIAFQEMSEWIVAQGRMQDVENCRQHFDERWSADEKRKAHEMLMELKQTLRSRYWKCAVGGRMPMPVIHSFLGKSQETFTRVARSLKNPREMEKTNESVSDKPSRKRRRQ